QDIHQAIDATAYSFADRWIRSSLRTLEAQVDTGFADYRFDNIASAIYHFVWDEYCDWYLELANVQLHHGSPSQHHATRRPVTRVLETLLRLAHPIIPFITEELWQRVSVVAGKRDATQTASISLQPYPVSDPSQKDLAAEQAMAEPKAQTEAVRALRSEMQLAPGQRVPLVATGEQASLERYRPYLMALARLSDVDIVSTLPEIGAPVQAVGHTQLMLHVEIDVDAERERLQKEKEKLLQQIAKAEGKLANSRFIERAPEKVVQQERDRKTSFEATLAKVDEQLARLATR